MANANDGQRRSALWVLKHMALDLWECRGGALGRLARRILWALAAVIGTLGFSGIYGASMIWLREMPALRAEVPACAPFEIPPSIARTTCRPEGGKWWFSWAPTTLGLLKSLPPASAEHAAWSLAQRESVARELAGFGVDREALKGLVWRWERPKASWRAWAELSGFASPTQASAGYSVRMASDGAWSESVGSGFLAVLWSACLGAMISGIVGVFVGAAAWMLRELFRWFQAKVSAAREEQDFIARAEARELARATKGGAARNGARGARSGARL